MEEHALPSLLDSHSTLVQKPMISSMYLISNWVVKLKVMSSTNLAVEYYLLDYLVEIQTVSQLSD